MIQIKERCIYCGSDVYYTGTESLIKCSMCGHTLVVAKFENELARIQQVLDEGEKAKKDLAEAEKAQRDAEERLYNTLDNLSDIKNDQDVLSRLLQLVMANQDSAEDKLVNLQSISERILSGEGDLFEAMNILGEIKDRLRDIGLDARAIQDYAKDFIAWFQNIHEDDRTRLKSIDEKAATFIAEQKAINVKLEKLKFAAQKTQKAVEEFQGQYTQDKLEELRQLYRQAEGFQHDRIYDQAENYYRQVIIKGGGDAEVYWRLLMCHYCVSYQRSDENRGELIPIILNPDLTAPEEMSLRTEFAAQIKNIPQEQKDVYDAELSKIDRILNKYRLIKGSVTYDVFISVKQQTDGNPTRDSFAAVTLYNTLTAKGLKVFNSRLTPPPAGQEFEPYIISALMSAKAMIVVGASRENMEAQWVKNEWSRFQWLQKSEKRLTGKTDRVLLCYLAEGMTPKDIPRGLNPNKQAIKADITADKQLDQALGFLIAGKQKPANEAYKNKDSSNSSAKRVISQMTTWLFLNKYDKVLEKYESLTEEGLYLDQVQVHLCALCAEKKVSKIEKIVSSETDLSLEPLYQLALNISDGTDEHKHLLSNIEQNIEWRKKHRAGLTLSKAETVSPEPQGKVKAAQSKVQNVPIKDPDHAIVWKDKNLEKAMREITGIKDRDIMHSDVKDITRLELSKKGISDISSISEFDNLTYLDLSFNKISNIDSLSKLSALTDLNLGSNQISDISSLSGLTKIKYLYLDNNQISDIKCLSKLVHLKSLYLGFNQISDINSLVSLKELESLSLCFNQISDTGSLSVLKNLKKLNVDNNPIRDAGDLSDPENSMELKDGEFDQKNDSIPNDPETGLDQKYEKEDKKEQNSEDEVQEHKSEVRREEVKKETRDAGKPIEQKSHVGNQKGLHKKFPLILILIAVCCAVAAYLWESNERAQIEVPDFKGLKLYSEEYENYKQQLVSHEIAVKTIVGEHGSLETCGSILNQEPAPGSTLSEGSVVTVYYDLGPGASYFNSYEVEEAEKIITAAGWAVEKDYVDSYYDKDGLIKGSFNNLLEHEIRLTISRLPGLDEELKDYTKDSGCSIVLDNDELYLKKGETARVNVTIDGDLPDLYTVFYSNYVDGAEVEWGDWESDNSCPLNLASEYNSAGYIRLYFAERLNDDDTEVTDYNVLAYRDLYVNITDAQ